MTKRRAVTVKQTKQYTKCCTKCVAAMIWENVNMYNTNSKALNNYYFNLLLVKFAIISPLTD